MERIQEQSPGRAALVTASADATPSADAFVVRGYRVADSSVISSIPIGPAWSAEREMSGYRGLGTCMRV